MPVQLDHRLNTYLNQTEIEGIFGAITTAVTYKDNPPVFQGIVSQMIVLAPFGLLIAQRSARTTMS